MKALYSYSFSYSYFILRQGFRFFKIIVLIYEWIISEPCISRRFLLINQQSCFITLYVDWLISGSAWLNRRRLLRVNIFYKDMLTEVTRTKPAYEISDFACRFNQFSQLNFPLLTITIRFYSRKYFSCFLTYTADRTLYGKMHSIRKRNQRLRSHS